MTVVVLNILKIIYYSGIIRGLDFTKVNKSVIVQKEPHFVSQNLPLTVVTKWNVAVRPDQQITSLVSIPKQLYNSNFSFLPKSFDSRLFAKS